MPPANQQQLTQQQQQQQLAAKHAELMAKFEEYVEKISYSERYNDDKYEYRHVCLPRPLLKLIPKHYFNPDGSGTLRLLSEAEWRGIGITQSLGWVHYEVHAPEPHVLLFRRELDFQPPAHLIQNGMHGRHMSHARFARK